MNEKRSRDSAIFGALGVSFDDEGRGGSYALPSFAGSWIGRRIPPELAAAIGPETYREGAWETIEIEDGAQLFFPTVGR